MGCEFSSISTALTLPDLPNKNYMNISIRGHDILMMFQYSGQPEIDTVRNAINATWTKGIQEEKLTWGNIFSFKLKRSPFSDFKGGEDSRQARLLSVAILKALYDMGWKLIASSELSCFVINNSWFFQRMTAPPGPCQMFSIGLSSSDRLQINDCPQHLHTIIKKAVEDKWSQGIQEEQTFDKTYEIKLNGNPWLMVDKTDIDASTRMLKEIIKKLTGMQFDLYGNSHVKGSKDTLYFQFNPNMVDEAELLIISLIGKDRIRLLNASSHVASAIKDAVEQNWEKGISDEKVDDDSFQLKLNGHPWWCNLEEAVQSRVLITRLIRKMAALGYHVITAIEISGTDSEKPFFLFRRGTEMDVPLMCMYLNGADRLRLIDAPTDVIGAVRAVLGHLPLNTYNEITDSEYLNAGVTYEASINGRPWSFEPEGTHLFIHLSSQMYSVGWRLVCSADVATKTVKREYGPDAPHDCHSFWFMYDQGLVNANAS